MATISSHRSDRGGLLARMRARGLSIPKRKKRVPRAQYPLGAEMAYQRDLLEITRMARAIVHRVLMPELPRIFAEAQALTRTDEDRADDYALILSRVFGEIRLQFEQVFTPQARAAARRSGQRVAETNGRELEKQVRSVLGIDIMQNESWLGSFIDSFVQQNVGLIESIPKRYFADIEQLVKESALNGDRPEALSQDLEERYGVSESRARLLARDQIGKLNGDITQVRQTKLGITSYTWSTAGDERVRESHRAHEGNVYAWDDPPADTGKPGDDYQCRCVALPNFDELLNDSSES